MFEEFVAKRKVLKLISDRTLDGKETTFRSLNRELDLTEEAACSHLKRLWNARLIETTSYRLKGFEFRLRRGESIREVRFRLNRRGKERLAWYAKDNDDAWSW